MKNIVLIFQSGDECWGKVIDYDDDYDNGIRWVEVEYELPGKKKGTDTIWINWTDKVGYCADIILTRLYEIEV